MNIEIKIQCKGVTVGDLMKNEIETNEVENEIVEEFTTYEVFNLDSDENDKFIATCIKEFKSNHDLNDNVEINALWLDSRGNENVLQLSCNVKMEVK